MSYRSSVVWSQGLFLRPQHFQQQARYHEHQRERHVLAVNSYAWGIEHIEFDSPQTTPGTLSIKSVSGIMPTGLYFDSKDDSCTPAPMHIPASASQLIVYLAIPSNSDQGVSIDSASVETRGDENSSRRFSAQAFEATDNTTSAPRLEKMEIDRSIDVAIPNLLLLKEGDSLEGMEIVAIAKIVEVDDTGAAILDESFVPTCVSILAAPCLGSMLNDTVTLLKKVILELSEILRESAQTLDDNGNNIEQTAEQQALIDHNHLAAHIFNQLSMITADLFRISGTTSMHPHTLYLELAKLHDYLCAIRLMPVDQYLTTHYQHLDISVVFAELHAGIVNELESLGERARNLVRPAVSYSENVQQDSAKEPESASDADSVAKSKGPAPIMVSLKDK